MISSNLLYFECESKNWSLMILTTYKTFLFDFFFYRKAFILATTYKKSKINKSLVMRRKKIAQKKNTVEQPSGVLLVLREKTKMQDEWRRTDGPPCGGVYLAQVAGDAHIVPGVVIELAVDRLHEGLEGPGTQVDDQPDGAALQRKVHIVSWLAGVQHEAISLQSSEGKRDLIGAALDGCQRQVVAEELIALEGGDWFFLTLRKRRGGQKRNVRISPLTETISPPRPAWAYSCTKRLPQSRHMKDPTKPNKSTTVS